MKNTVAKRLLDAYRFCDEVAGYVSGQTEESYCNSQQLQRAVERVVEILGEALRQAEAAADSGELDSSISDLREIIDTRHRLAHGYDSIDQAVMWAIAAMDVPKLRLELKSLLIANGYGRGL